MAGRSPLAPAPAFLSPLAGVRLGAAASGVRYSGRRDLMLAVFDRDVSVAGMFTRSAMASPAVSWSRTVAGSGRARALVVNSGNANTFTGQAGEQAVQDTVSAVTRLVGCAEDAVCISSTGVIGEPLPVGKIIDALPPLYATLHPNGWADAADAIRTTDTFSKSATARATLNGREVTINGIAKGSGMIAPDMATMLAYVMTDAELPPPLLQAMLKAGADRSFNAITVDSDMSTSDTVLLFATGAVTADPALVDGR